MFSLYYSRVFCIKNQPQYFQVNFCKYYYRKLGMADYNHDSNINLRTLSFSSILVSLQNVFLSKWGLCKSKTYNFSLWIGCQQILLRGVARMLPYFYDICQKNKTNPKSAQPKKPGPWVPLVILLLLDSSLLSNFFSSLFSRNPDDNWHSTGARHVQYF